MRFGRGQLRTLFYDTPAGLSLLYLDIPLLLVALLHIRIRPGDQNITYNP